MKRRDFLARARAVLLLPALPAIAGNAEQAGAVLPKSEWLELPTNVLLPCNYHAVNWRNFDDEVVRISKLNMTGNRK